MDNLTTWIPLALSVGAALGTGYSWWEGRGLRRADEAAKISEAAMGVVDALEGRISRLEADLASERESRRALEGQLSSLKVRVVTLEAENRVLLGENIKLQEELSRRRGGL